MNPYLQPRWRDFHHGLITYTRDILQKLLPDDLRARMQERVYIEQEHMPVRAVSPDVHVYQRPNVHSGSSQDEGDVAVAEPLVAQLLRTEVRETFVEVIDAATGGRVITAIEFLSPSNKVPGPGRNLYLQKQGELLDSDTNLVEVDLVRSGQSTTLLSLSDAPEQQRTRSHVSIRRASRPAQLEFYPLPLRIRLPKIRVPLRAVDPDIALDLQKLVRLCHENGGYDDINYSAPADPPLESEDADWAHEILRAKGLI